MARPLRIQYPGAVYHITCRGNARQNIYKDNEDRKRFLELLTESQKIYSIKIYSYVLMDNHFHLLIETPHGNLSEYMRHFNIRYTGHYNRRHKRTGHLYQGRYKSILVDKDTYLTMLSRYIHLNPVRITGMKDMPYKEKMLYLQKYKWSSLAGYINKRKKQEFIDYDFVLEEYGGDNEKGRQAYGDIISIDVSGKMDIKDKIIGRSIIGKEDFIERVVDRYLKRENDIREQPSLREIHGLRAKGEILRAIKEATGKDLDEIKKLKGSERNVLMDLLYRAGGIKGVEIGKLLEVDYSTVSQGRKRLRDKLKKDKKLKQIVNLIEGKLL
jgi:REP element-mobilizing transposase RayT